MQVGKLAERNGGLAVADLRTDSRQLADCPKVGRTYSRASRASDWYNFRNCRPIARKSGNLQTCRTWRDLHNCQPASDGRLLRSRRTREQQPKNKKQNQTAFFCDLILFLRRKKSCFNTADKAKPLFEQRFLQPQRSEGNLPRFYSKNISQYLF